MGLDSFGVVGFDRGPLFQGQKRVAKLKSAYSSLIIKRPLKRGRLLVSPPVFSQPPPPPPHYRLP